MESDEEEEEEESGNGIDLSVLTVIMDVLECDSKSRCQFLPRSVESYTTEHPVVS